MIGRIPDGRTRGPSVFAHQVKESTVNTDPKGPIDSIADRQTGADETLHRAPGFQQVFHTERSVRELLRQSGAGVYVFRLFDVAHKDIDEIAGLYPDAWASTSGRPRA